MSGVVFFCGLLYWILPTFKTAGEPLLVSLPALLIFSAYLALYFAVFSLLFNAFSKTNTILKTAFLVSCLWVVLEYLRGCLFTGFPWGIIGYTQWNNLWLIQSSDILGVYGISFVIIFANITLYYSILLAKEKYVVKSIVENKKLSETYLLMIISSLLIIVFLRYGDIRLYFISKTPQKNTVKITVLQGNVDQYKKWDEQYVSEILCKYSVLSADAYKKDSPDLIVWPESSVPGYLLENEHLSLWLKNLISKSKTCHLIGSPDYQNGKYYNSAVLISQEGKLKDKYDKIHLVPFGELVPLKSVLSKYISALNSLGDFTAGKKMTVFNISNEPKTAFSANICFEAIFPSLISKFENHEFIVNITNDGWYLKTSAPYQHFVFNTFRAIENRKPLIRCANTGISAYIDKTGRVINKTELFETTFQTYSISPNKIKTIYAIYGDIFVLLSFFYLLYQTNVLIILFKIVKIWLLKISK